MVIDEMLRKLDSYKYANRRQRAYYEGRYSTPLGFSVPPELKFFASPMDWPRTIVDVLDERMNIVSLGDDSADEFAAGIGFENLYHQAHIEAFIHGISYMVLTPAVADSPLDIRIASPLDMTGEFDNRGVLKWAISRMAEDTIVVYTLDEIVEYRRDRGGWVKRGGMVNVSARLNGAQPVIPFVNQPRPGNPYGASEITRAIRGHCDSAVRTMAAMEANREFNSGKAYAILGVDPDEVKGKFRAGIDSIWALDRDRSGDLPQIQELSPSSPMPYIDQINLLARTVASAAAIPESYLGVSTSNPTSAEAINASEVRLVRRAARRQAGFSHCWGAFTQAVTGVYRSPVWEAPETPTLAATADAVSKLAGAGIIPAGSPVLLDMLHIPPRDRAGIDDARAEDEARITALAAQSLQASDAALAQVEKTRHDL